MNVTGDASLRGWLPASLAPFAGAGIRVAVIDSGVNGGNPHVGGVGESAFFSPGADGAVRIGDDGMDMIGHGTACAAVIRGWAPGCTLLSAKVFHGGLAADTELVIAALQWASSRGAHVINLSLGTYREERFPRLEAACVEASEAGAVIVAPVPDVHNLPAPARFPSVVTALPDDELREFSLFRGKQEGVDFIVYPYPRRIPGIEPERNFMGPSFASAHLSGLVSLVREGWPGATRSEVKEILWALLEENHFERRRK